jgi:hypothetical protein
MAEANSITFRLDDPASFDLCVVVGAAARSDDPALREIGLRVRRQLIDSGILPAYTPHPPNVAPPVVKQP